MDSAYVQVDAKCCMWACRTAQIICCALQLGLLIVNVKNQSANLGSRGAWFLLLFYRFLTPGRYDRSER